MGGECGWSPPCGSLLGCPCPRSISSTVWTQSSTTLCHQSWKISLTHGCSTHGLYLKAIGKQGTLPWCVFHERYSQCWVRSWLLLRVPQEHPKHHRGSHPDVPMLPHQQAHPGPGGRLLMQRGKWEQTKRCHPSAVPSPSCVSTGCAGATEPPSCCLPQPQLCLCCGWRLWDFPSPDFLRSCCKAQDGEGAFHMRHPAAPSPRLVLRVTRFPHPEITRNQGCIS